MTNFDDPFWRILTGRRYLMMHIQGSLTIYVYLTEGSQPKPSFAIATRLPHLVYTDVKWKPFWLYIYIYIYIQYIFIYIYICMIYMCFFFSDATCRNPPKTQHNRSTARGRAPRIQWGGRSGILPRPCGSETWNWTWRKRGSLRSVKGFCLFFWWILYLKRGVVDSRFWETYVYIYIFICVCVSYSRVFFGCDENFTWKRDSFLCEEYTHHEQSGFRMTISHV